MHFNQRNLMLCGVAAGIDVASPLSHAQKSGCMLHLGQSFPLIGAPDQIGRAYFNGAKMYFGAGNTKKGIAGYEVEVKFLDDVYNATEAAVNAKQLIDEGVELFGFAGTASCNFA